VDYEILVLVFFGAIWWIAVGVSALIRVGRKVIRVWQKI
jgi:hypothetical protein